MSQPLRMHQIKRIIELYQEGRSIWETKRLTGLAEPTLADAIMDRLLTNANGFELKGESLRKKSTANSRKN